MSDQPELFKYGLQTEQSDIRAHVAVAARRLIVFQTATMLALIKTGKYPSKEAWQPGEDEPTARGYIVPVADIPDFRELFFKSYDWAGFPPRSGSTSSKGAAAVAVVCAVMRLGRFPLWLDAAESNDKDVQIAGTDIVVQCNKRVQVKCDWWAGLKTWGNGCTGNVYIQTAERNPFKRH